MSPVSCVVGGVVLASGHTKLSSQSMTMATLSFSLLVVVSRLATRGSLADDKKCKTPLTTILQPELGDSASILSVD